MWTRVQLKANAKNILMKNYWWAVLIAIILSVVSGAGLSSGISGRSNAVNSQVNTNEYDDTAEGILDNTYNLYENSGLYQLQRNIDDILNIFSKTAIYVLLSLILAIGIAVAVLNAFVLAPLEVGCKRWLILNRTMKPDFGEVGNNFKVGYMNTVKIMFCRNLFIFLWSLLFVIPGIIKSYEYRMIPYLLAENPDMDMHEAFAMSRDMMRGNKLEAVVLDLSFIGWMIASTFTFGLLTIFFVNPYIHLTDTELYVALCRSNNSGSEDRQANNGQSEHWQEV